MTKSEDQRNTIKETPATYTGTPPAEPALPTGAAMTGPAVGLDVHTVHEAIAELERALAILKRIAAQVQPSVPAGSDTPKRCFSLYGIFPATHTAWQDFQDAKHAWRKEVGDIA